MNMLDQWAFWIAFAVTVALGLIPYLALRVLSRRRARRQEVSIGYVCNFDPGTGEQTHRRPHHVAVIRVKGDDR
jgi:hypothetical protein